MSRVGTSLSFYIFFFLFLGSHLPTCNQKQGMVSRLLKTIILGPPGSGKGTISERIIKDFRMKHLSSGDYLRWHMTNKTDIGMQVKQCVDTGALVPDSVIIGLISNELRNYGEESWLLDGFPRTIQQAHVVQEQHGIHAVINLDVPFEVIVERIKGRWLHPSSGKVYHTEFNPPTVPGMDDTTGEPLIQREDDKEHTVRKRLKEYQLQTEPVLEYYRNRGLLTEFRGQASNELWPHVHKYLSTIAEPMQYTKYG